MLVRKIYTFLERISYITLKIISARRGFHDENATIRYNHLNAGIVFKTDLEQFGTFESQSEKKIDKKNNKIPVLFKRMAYQ
jgi:hypothetical protein